MSALLLDLQAVRAALAAQLDGSFAGAVNVYPNMPAAPRLPYIAVVPSSPYVSYHETFGPQGLSDVALTLMIDVGARTVDTQIALDDYLGVATPRSVYTCLEADPTLGGAVQSCVPLTASVVNDPETGFYATIPLRIIVKKGGNA